MLRNACVQQGIPDTSRPQVSIEHPIVDCLVEMEQADGLAAVEIGNRAGNAEDLVVRSGGKTHFGHRAFQEVLALVAKPAELTVGQRLMAALSTTLTAVRA